MGSGHLSSFSIEDVLQLSRLWDLQLETLNCKLLGTTHVVEELTVQSWNSTGQPHRAEYVEFCADTDSFSLYSRNSH